MVKIILIILFVVFLVVFFSGLIEITKKYLGK